MDTNSLVVNAAAVTYGCVPLIGLHEDAHVLVVEHIFILKDERAPRVRRQEAVGLLRCEAGLLDQLRLGEIRVQAVPEGVRRSAPGLSGIQQKFRMKSARQEGPAPVNRRCCL